MIQLKSTIAKNHKSLATVNECKLVSNFLLSYAIANMAVLVVIVFLSVYASAQLRLSPRVTKDLTKLAET
jgi:hypothetical protein